MLCEINKNQKIRIDNYYRRDTRPIDFNDKTKVIHIDKEKKKELR
jgi:hypothetical protein